MSSPCRHGKYHGEYCMQCGYRVSAYGGPFSGIDPWMQNFWPQGLEQTAISAQYHQMMAQRHAEQMANFQRRQLEAYQAAQMAAVQTGHFDAKIQCGKHQIEIEDAKCKKCEEELLARQKQEIEERKALFGEELYDLMMETDKLLATLNIKN